jgi:hypothetical protein
METLIQIKWSGLLPFWPFANKVRALHGVHIGLNSGEVVVGRSATTSATLPASPQACEGHANRPAHRVQASKPNKRQARYVGDGSWLLAIESQ